MKKFLLQATFAGLMVPPIAFVVICYYVSELMEKEGQGGS